MSGTLLQSVTTWHEEALEANRRDFSRDAGLAPEQGGPCFTSRALAIAHVAMADAYANAAGGTGAPPFPPLVVTAAPPGPAHPEAALGAAAFAALVALFPAQCRQFETTFASFVMDLRDSGAANVDAGLNFGTTVARRVLADRAQDGAAASGGAYAAGELAGMHNADPLNPGQGFYVPRWGRVRPFGIDAAQTVLFMPKPPPALYEQDYLDAHAEVLRLGRKLGSDRTEDQTRIGLFWAYDGARRIGTPPRLYNQIVAAVARRDGYDGVATLRLLALVNVAMADAGIVAWHAKYYYDLWRPVLGIRNAVQGLGATGAVRDPLWMPLGAPRSNSTEGLDVTPNFPAYPSGHATFGSACFNTLRQFRKLASATGAGAEGGALAGFRFTSDELNGVTTDSSGVVRPNADRALDSIGQMIDENLRSRVYLGVHWIFDGVEGNRSGELIAERLATKGVYGLMP